MYGISYTYTIINSSNISLSDSYTSFDSYSFISSYVLIDSYSLSILILYQFLFFNQFLFFINSYSSIDSYVLINSYSFINSLSNFLPATDIDVFSEVTTQMCLSGIFLPNCNSNNSPLVKYSSAKLLTTHPIPRLRRAN